MGNKRNASIGIYSLYTIVECILLLSFISCSNSRRTEKPIVNGYQDTRTIYLVDINGDTIRITGGATCHIDKKVNQ